MISTNELSWLAGFLEGEGTFILGTEGNVKIAAASVDLDVLEKIMSIVNIGNITGPYKYSGRQAYYIWNVGKQANVAGFLMTIYPLMGDRRQERIQVLLKVWRNTPFRRRGPRKADNNE